MKRLLLFVLSLLPVFLLADNVPVEKAQELATAFFRKNLPHRASLPALQLLVTDEVVSTRSAGEAPAYYVFGDADSKGFVIVAGDDAVMPVLAYSFESSFPKSNLPVNLKAWLKGIGEEIATERRAAGKGTVTRSSYLAKEWTTTRAAQPVVELETAKWDQDTPYNLLCPYVNGKETYVGCTATATAIVMHYHRWPDAGVGVLSSYTTVTHKQFVPALPLGHAYEWDKMQKKYNMLSPEAAKQAVATLMRDCATMLESDFCPVGSNGTAAYVQDVARKLQEYMKYDKSARFLSRNAYPFAEWKQMMKAELDADRPVLYGGSSIEGGGHAFVLDGYDAEDYFRVNWGWSGYYDGYFLLSALDPSGLGIGGGDGGYNWHQSAIVGLKKDEGGEPVEELRFSYYKDDENGMEYNGLTTSATEFKENTPFYMNVGFLGNSGSAPFTGKFGLACTDKNGQVKEVLAAFKSEEQLKIGYGYCFSCELTVTKPIAPGDRIRAYWVHSKTGERMWVKGNEEEGCVWDFILREEFNLGKASSLTYNKRTRLLTLSVPVGTAVQLSAADGSSSRQCDVKDGQVSIDTGELPAGTYQLLLQLEEQSKTLRFKVGDPVR